MSLLKLAPCFIHALNRVDSLLNQTISSVRALQITAVHTESLVEGVDERKEEYKNKGKRREVMEVRREVNLKRKESGKKKIHK